MATLELKSINKAFGTAQILHDIELAINDKEFVVFVGPSGCGKSTLLRIIAGLEEASSGQILIEGQDVGQQHPVERGISMVFQSYALYPHLSIFENIAFPLRVQKIQGKELKARVEKAAEILQLTDKLMLKPSQLSGGQRQRVAIGRSIVREPKIFLFDEPLSNLDAALRGDMRVELSQLHRALDATMVYVTHDQVEAMTMADRIVVLNGGRVEQFGSPMSLYHHPKSRFVAGFIGQLKMNFLEGRVTQLTPQHLSVRLLFGLDITLNAETDGVSVGDTVEIGIRPEHVRQGGQVPVEAQVVERLGGVTLVYGQLSDGTRFCASLDGDAQLQEGEVTKMDFGAQNCHVFTADGQALPRLQAPEQV